MSRALLALAPLSLLVLGGCPPSDPDDTGSDDSGIACDEMAYSSIQLTIAAVDGLDMADVVANYSASGGAAVDCETFDPGEFVCGWEVQGPIAVHVEAPGFEPHDETIVIEADECHVITAEMVVTLEPEVVAQ
jgi:hypothetical protein